jgi:hypothetical protein
VRNCLSWRPTNRDYWEKRGSKATLKLADELHEIAREIDPALEPSYNRHYIGIYKNNQPPNFCIFRPKKHTINIVVRLARADDIDRKIEETGIEELSGRGGIYRLSLQKDDIAKHREFLKQLMQAAYQIRTM